MIVDEGKQTQFSCLARMSTPGWDARHTNSLTAALRDGAVDAFVRQAEDLRRSAHAAQPAVCSVRSSASLICCYCVFPCTLQLIKDRTYHLRSYKQCFKGSRFIDWLVERKYVVSRLEVLPLWCLRMIVHNSYVLCRALRWATPCCCLGSYTMVGTACDPM